MAAKSHDTEIEALEALLATCGADRTRWPAPARLRFASLLATDAEAKRLLEETAALDRLLDMAPAPAGATSALADRILAAAAREAAQKPELREIRIPARAPAPGRGVYTWQRGRAAAAAMHWPAAGLLAASLVLGAFAGTSGALDSAIAPFATAASAESDMDASQLVFGFELTDSETEDVL